MCSIKFIIIYFLLCFHVFSTAEKDINPYEILGVARTASDQEIRQAYKKLAKHWHPDKNSQPNAHEQFTKINHAYEILSDSTKRQNYDEYGTTSEGGNYRGFNTNHFRDPFDIFRTFFQEAPSGAKKVIHSYEFLKTILPNSDKKPYLMFGSTNFCFHCRRALMIFRSIENQLNEAGIGTGEFNVHDERLSSELGVSNIPSLSMVIRGRVYHFAEEDFTERNIKEFVRKSISMKRFIRELKSINEFTRMISSSNQTNRVHALLITRQKSPTLKFVIPCLQYSLRVQCAYFNSSVIRRDHLPAYFQSISFVSDTILLFKEDIDQVEMVIKDNDINLNSIEKIFQANQLLHLPTITSANVFDLVCQTNSVKPCFLLIGNANLFAQYHSTFLHLSKGFYQRTKTHLAYLDSSPRQQAAFTTILSPYYQQPQKKLLILAVRRWYDGNIEIQNTQIEFNEKNLDEFERQPDEVTDKLELFLNNRWPNSKKHALPMIFDLDERYEDVLSQFIDRFEAKWNYFVERNRFLRYFVSYLYTYTFWILTMFFIVCVYYMRQGPEQSELRQNTSERTSRTKIYRFDQPVLERYTQTGAPNVIILLLIADSKKDPCVGKFQRDIESIKDSHFIFSILYREQSSRWLDELSRQIPKDYSTISLSPSTVLALYIRRKFFVAYSSNNHQQHQEEQQQQQADQSTSTLTFFDWIDLLLNGNFREPITVTDWPRNFH